MKIKRQNKIYSAGQTLIETLAAVFILTMGLTASVGLAIYAFNSSGGIVKQIIATGLAREGLEAVRNMRDTNWLQDTIKDPLTNPPGCYNFASSPVGQLTADCYVNWLNKTFCLNSSDNSTNNCNGTGTTAGNFYYLGFDSSAANLWILKKDNNSYYGLNFNANNSGTTGFYSPGSGVTCLNSNSGYCRKIIITNDTTDAPYNNDANLSMLKVQSQVWWVDKKCPAASDFSSASVSCRLELDTYLTNWKNF